MPTDFYTIPSFVIGCLALLFGIYAHHSKVIKKLNQILDAKSGVIEKNQALDLVDLYLASIQVNFRRKIEYFIENEYPNLKLSGDRNGIYVFVNENADDTIRRTRGLVKSFNIISGQNFREFLDKENPIDSGIIETTINNVCIAFYNDMESATSSEQNLFSNIIKEIMTAGEQSRNLLIAKVEKVYKS